MVMSKEKLKEFVKKHKEAIVVGGVSVIALGITRGKLNACRHELDIACGMVTKYIVPYTCKDRKVVATDVLCFKSNDGPKRITEATEDLLNGIKHGEISNDIVTGAVYYVKK